jgi:hypothetical protein
VKPADGHGRGELWLTFKYDDAQLSTGVLKLSEIRQGYHYRIQAQFDSDLFKPERQRWGPTHDHDAGRALHQQMKDAGWRLAG